MRNFVRIILILISVWIWTYHDYKGSTGAAITLLRWLQDPQLPITPKAWHNCLPNIAVLSGTSILPSCFTRNTGPWFNIKMPSYQYRKSHCGDKTILWPSYLHNGIAYTGKTISLYWIRALVTVLIIYHMWGNWNDSLRTGQIKITFSLDYWMASESFARILSASWMFYPVMLPLFLVLWLEMHQHRGRNASFQIYIYIYTYIYTAGSQNILPFLSLLT